MCEESDNPDRPPFIGEDSVIFNGKEEAGHETFVLERAAHRSFCKTGGILQMDVVNSWGKSYDVAVCCALISARRHLGEVVSSDGDWSEEGWMRGRALYAHVTSFLSPCLWPQKTCAQCSRTFCTDGHAWGGSDVCRKCGGGSCRIDMGKVTCSDCGLVGPFQRAKPTDWCWYCSNGYKDKKDAAANLKKRWDQLVASLKLKNMRVL